VGEPEARWLPPPPPPLSARPPARYTAQSGTITTLLLKCATTFSRCDPSEGFGKPPGGLLAGLISDHDDCAASRIRIRRESNVAGKGKRRHVSSSDEEVEAGAARKDVEAANADAVAGIFPENAACAWMLHGRPQPFPKNSRQFDEDKSPRGSWNRHVSSLQRGGEGWPESSMPNISSHRGSWIRPSSPGLPNLRRSNSPTSGMCVECNVTSGVSLPASRRFSQDTRGFASYPSSPLGSVADGTGRRHSTSSPAAMLLKSPAVRAALGSSWLLPNPIEDFANAHQAGEKAARAGDGDDEALDDDDDDDDGEPTVFALSKSKRAASEGE
jgi:hypothetical protein